MGVFFFTLPLKSNKSLIFLEEIQVFFHNKPCSFSLENKTSTNFLLSSPNLWFPTTKLSATKTTDKTVLFFKIKPYSTNFCFSKIKPWNTLILKHSPTCSCQNRKTPYLLENPTISNPILPNSLKSQQKQKPWILTMKISIDMVLPYWPDPITPWFFSIFCFHNIWLNLLNPN